MEKYFNDDSKRILHAKKVLEYAEKIMTKEGGEKRVIMPAAILHDIGIKECERKYNSTNGKLQEKEGPPIAKRLLDKINYDCVYVDEILEIIANHHSFGKVNTLNFQIIYEADWLVNLAEDFKKTTRAQKERIINKNFKTEIGIRIARKLF